MSDKTITGYKRETVGTSDSRRLRREGNIPAVIYGKDGVSNIYINAKDFERNIGTLSESTIITIKIGRKKHAVLIKDYQGALLSTDLLHIDFFEVTKGETLRTHVPFNFEGSPVGVKEGGLLEQVMHEIEVECLPKDLPESVTVSIAAIALGESLHVRDIEFPAGVKPLADEDDTVVTVVTKKSESDDAAAEEEETEVAGE